MRREWYFSESEYKDIQRRMFSNDDDRKLFYGLCNDLFEDVTQEDRNHLLRAKELGSSLTCDIADRHMRLLKAIEAVLENKPISQSHQKPTADMHETSCALPYSMILSCLPYVFTSVDGRGFMQNFGYFADGERRKHPVIREEQFRVLYGSELTEDLLENLLIFVEFADREKILFSFPALCEDIVRFFMPGGRLSARDDLMSKWILEFDPV